MTAARQSLPEPLRIALAQYDDWSGRFLAEETERNTVRTPLYHYTDASGLKGILESGQFWYSHYLHLNDPSELDYGIGLLKELVRELERNNDGRAQLLFECVCDLARRENFQDVLDFYITCFSRKFDDLGQWRAYADNGRGYAIGISPSAFEVQPPPSDGAPSEFLGAVHYRPEDIRHRHLEALESGQRTLLTAANCNPEAFANPMIGKSFLSELARSMLASPIIWNCLTAKHRAYEQEDEVRQIILGQPKDLEHVVMTRIRQGSLVPYIPMQFDLRHPGKLSAIVVGPAAPPDAEVGVRRLLDHLGIADVPVLRSQIPYRV